MSQFAFKHQREKVAPDRANAWQPVVRHEHDFGAKTENFSVNRSADHCRNIFVFGDKGSGDNDIKARFCSTLRYPFTGPVNLSSSHGRACSETRARFCSASRFRCLRNIAASLASIVCLRSLWAYWRSAARTSAVRLRRRDDDSVNLSRSFNVASSIAMVFIVGIISAVSHRAQHSASDLLSRATDKMLK